MKQTNYIVLIGVGYWGSKILDKLIKLKKRVIVFDTNNKQLENIQKKYPKKKITTINKLVLLKNFNYDSVLIASPAQFHFNHINYFISLNKNIFVEKPLCIEFSEIKKIKAKLKNYKKIFMVGHLMHYHNAFKKIKFLKKKNFFGNILYLYSSRLSFGKLRRHENILSSFAPHDLSMIIALMDSNPVITNCTGSKILSKKVYDNSIINLRFKNNINSHIFVNWLSPFKEQKFVVIGSKNMLVFDDTQEWDKKIVCIHKPLIKSDKSYVLNSKKLSFLKVKKNDALLDELKYFFYCIKQKKSPISNIDESIKIYSLLDTAIKKIKKSFKNEKKIYS